MKEKFEIIPFVSVNNMKFGMTLEDIEYLIGKPNDLINDEIMGEVRAYYSNFVLIFIRKKLIEFSFNESIGMNELEIIVNGGEIVNNVKIIDVLSELPKSKPSEIKRGSINFYGLGINLGGFKKSKYFPKKEIRVFSKGRIKYYELYLNA